MDDGPFGDIDRSETIDLRWRVSAAASDCILAHLQKSPAFWRGLSWGNEDGNRNALKLRLGISRKFDAFPWEREFDP
jgi:hypothetical protein